MVDIDWARKTLGLQGVVTEETVTTAFRRACLSKHPDHGGSSKDFIEAKMARDLLLVYSTMKTPQSVETEGKWTKKVVKALEDSGAITFKVHGHAMQESGWPDLQVYYGGKVWHLELKTGHRGCEPLQKHKIKELLRVGIHAYVFALREDGMWLENWDGSRIFEVEHLRQLLPKISSMYT